jgi:hypothetical protein
MRIFFYLITAVLVLGALTLTFVDLPGIPKDFSQPWWVAIAWLLVGIYAELARIGDLLKRNHELAETAKLHALMAQVRTVDTDIEPPVPPEEAVQALKLELEKSRHLPLDMR